MKKVIKATSIAQEQALKHARKILTCGKQLFDLLEESPEGLIESADLNTLYDELVETLPALDFAIKSGQILTSTNVDTHKPIVATIEPQGGDMENFWSFYTGPGYGVDDEAVKQFGREHQCTCYWWATDSYHFDGIYNGDTYCVCREIETLPDGYKQDAEKYGKPIDLGLDYRKVDSSIVYQTFRSTHPQYCKTVDELVNTLLRVSDGDDYIYSNARAGHITECEVSVQTKTINDDGFDHEMVVLNIVK